MSPHKGGCIHDIWTLPKVSVNVDNRHEWTDSGQVLWFTTSLQELSMCSMEMHSKVDRLPHTQMHFPICTKLLIFHTVAGKRGERGTLEVPQKAEIKQPQMADTRIEVPEVQAGRQMQLRWLQQLPP